jgi:DsbC/DsbD-like thiol-disulfide interchange protein
LPRSVNMMLVAGVGFALGLALAVPPVHSAGEAAGLISGPWLQLHAGSRIRLLGVAGKSAGEINGAIEIELADGWKTYWRMPGDAGVPPQFEWKGSGNLASATVMYPAPKRLAEPAAETVGYKTHVVFPLAAKAHTSGQPIALKLEAEFGICKEICVPAQASLALELPSAAQPAVLPGPIAQAMKRVPVAAEAGESGRPSLIASTSDLAGAQPWLRLEARFPGGAEAADLFIEAPESIYVPMTKRVADTAQGQITFEVRLPAATAQDLKGKTLTLTLVGATGATEAHWKLP